MTSRYIVWLNDISLAEIDPCIYVSDINYQAISPSLDLNRLATLDGQYTANKGYIKENRISISFEVREYNTARRQEIVQYVIAWASRGGWIKTNDRLGQKIYVKPVAFPAVSSVMRWTDNLVLQFAAYDYPFWLDETAQTVELENGESGQLYLPGVWRSFVEARIKAKAALSSCTIVCGNTRMILSNLSVSNGGVIKIEYSEDHHILSISIGSLSLLNARSTTSDDDLIAEVGQNNVSFAASGAATCTLSARGVYL